MASEDAFHDQHGDRCWPTFVLRFPPDDWHIVARNVCGTAVRRVLEEIYKDNHISIEPELLLSEVLEGRSRVVRLETACPGQLTFRICHRRVGGPRFLELFTALLDAAPRVIPVFNAAWGAAALLRRPGAVEEFMRLPRVSEHVDPSVGGAGAAFRNLVCIRDVSDGAVTGSRRFAAYAAAPDDCTFGCGQRLIRVGFTVPFRAERGVINSVGIVILDYVRGTSAGDLERSFQRQRITALLTRAFSSFAGARGPNPAIALRERLHVVCTSFVYEAPREATHVNYLAHIRPDFPITEMMYLSLFSRLEGRHAMTVRRAIATRSEGAVRRLRKVGYALE